MTFTLRVRIHLNLANPAQAENVVKVKLPGGTWSTVAYAKELLLQNCLPHVDPSAKERIRAGESRKVPHAYIEGDLVHFSGRLRALAPKRALDLARPHLVASPDFSRQAEEFLKDPVRINYNPRFARCFYKDAPTRDQVTDRFVCCDSMLVLGWSFMGRGVELAPLLPTDRCRPEDLAKASPSERSVLRRGHETTAQQVARIHHNPRRGR